MARKAAAVTPDPVEPTAETEQTPTEAAPATEETAPKSVSVRITGKRGKVNVDIDPEKVQTVSDVIVEAARQLGVNVDFSSITIIVDGEEASADTPVEGATKIDATPHARLG